MPFDALSDTMIMYLRDRGITLCIHGTTIRALTASSTFSYCGDGCCSFEHWDITDHLTDTRLDSCSTGSIIPILELTPEWVEFLRSRPVSPDELDLSPIVD